MADEIEKAQKDLRVMDYDSISEAEDDNENGSGEGKIVVSRSTAMAASRDVIDDRLLGVVLPSPEVSPESAFTLERFLSSVDANEKIDSKGTDKNERDNVLIDTSHRSTQTTKFRPRNSTSNSAVATTNSGFPPVASLSSSLSPLTVMKDVPVRNSLMDEDNSTAASLELQTFKTDNNKDDANADLNTDRAHSLAYPGTAGYLEMEEEPLRDAFQDYDTNDINRSHNHAHNKSALGGDSIKTDSGLVLTHRKTGNALSHQDHRRHFPHQSVFRDAQQNYFEADNGVSGGWKKEGSSSRRLNEEYSHSAEFGSGRFGGFNGKHSSMAVQAKRLLSYVKIWVLISLLVFLAMTGVFFHSMGHTDDNKTSASKTDKVLTGSASSLRSSPINMNADTNSIGLSQDTALDNILLLPLPDSSHLSSPSLQYNHQQFQHNFPRRLQSQTGTIELRSADYLADSRLASNRDGASFQLFVQDLRQEFESWIQHHGKFYHSEDEKERRFSIWSQNHQRTTEKNTRHGPCTLTKQHVFGSNQFKDLAPEEFQRKFLTGYKGEYTDVLEKKEQELPLDARKLRKDSGVGMVLDPKIHKLEIHESVVKRQRHLNQRESRYKPKVMGSSSFYCKWYDLSCILRYIWLSTGIQFGSLVGTMEPKYDANAFPNSVDWRDSGAVTDIRTQGECGACWAVTAVETVESAHFISTGTLYELSESEIIVCDDSCEMCSGGWPQNAYEWVMDHGGLPLQSTLPYDAYTLIALTAGLEGESEYYDESTVESYRAEVCPADDDSRSDSNSNDNSYWEDGKENQNYADYSDKGRYGNIKGYGYATDRCLCYTDGSGCDCDDQDEDTAVRNIATYGPAAVCLEASTWQDYAGGIMTSSIGCGQEFLDMNHCVQVVGYAFTTADDCGGDDENCDDSKDGDSGSKSNSRSGDSSDREGYWIVRNQWGENWGMNGYAYVSMGENTCGILNDMTIAYV